MKKILFVLILGSLVLPNLAQGAISGPVDCCKMRRAVDVDGLPCNANEIAGPTGTVPGSAACPFSGVLCVNAGDKWGVYCTINTMNAAVDWIFVILVTLSIVLTIMGAFQIMMSAGEPAKVEGGRNYIMYAALGLLVGFIARAIPSIVKAVMGY